MQTSGVSVIVAALILGLSIVGGSFLIKQSVDQGASELRTVLAEIQKAPPAAAPAPSRQQAARPGRPDPNREYEVDISGAPVKGATDAPITVVEFSDFQCPFCKRVNPTIAQVEQEYGDKVKVAFKHLPLSIHSKAPAAHAAAEAAHRQGKFWEMHDLIFANQAEMSPGKYEEYAQQLGLDMDKYREDVKSPAVKARIDADTRLASTLGVSGTPAFFVNGRFLSGAQPFPSFKRLIDEQLAEN